MDMPTCGIPVNDGRGGAVQDDVNWTGVKDTRIEGKMVIPAIEYRLQDSRRLREAGAGNVKISLDSSTQCFCFTLAASQLVGQLRIRGFNGFPSLQ